MLPAALSAHGGNPHRIAQIGHAYTFDPMVLVPMFIAGVLYLAGIARLWRRAGYGRGVAGWRVGCFIGALLTLSLALIWPLDELATAALSAHMAQHVMLTAVAAPLLAMSAPLVSGLFALPAFCRRSIGCLLRHGAFRAGKGLFTLPVFAWLLYTLVLWSWHMPSLYQAAVLNHALHTLEHLSFFASALLLWWTVFLSARGNDIGLGSGIFLLFTTALQEGLLGAVLTFSQRTLYPIYESTPGLWGITPLEDQQFAGVLMWIPGGLVYLSASLLLGYRWLVQLGRSHPVPEHADA